MTYMLRLHSESEIATWARFKSRAQAEGIPMRALMLLLVEAYADGKYVIQARKSDAIPHPHA